MNPKIGPHPVVALVDNSALTRESLAGMIAASSEFRVRAIPNVKSIPCTATVVLLNIKSLQFRDPRVQRQIASIQKKLPDVPLMLLGYEDESGTVGATAIAAGLNGYVASSASGDLLIAAIRLVVCGGVFIMPEAIRECAAHWSNPCGAMHHPH